MKEDNEMGLQVAGEMPVGRVKPCRVIDFEQHHDPRGSLTVVDSEGATGFSIQRVYYLHDITPRAVRGGHAHRETEQLIIAVAGNFEATVTDGLHHATYRLDQPGQGLYVGPMVWVGLESFSPGAVGLILASSHYDEADYCRDYNEFLHVAGSLP
ncbi:sugar 3,4-ketoisomerase (plasmid) [Streptomyces sp. CA-142005]|uniref:sugar 3,4-ketoisomerase n=1 Tax=Streptomyces sp. CA-142005 TaxID=3240052 RepID=UPI003D8A3B52